MSDFSFIFYFHNIKHFAHVPDCCPPCHDVVSAPLRNPLIYTVKSPHPFILSSPEVKTSAASTPSIYIIFPHFHHIVFEAACCQALHVHPSKILIYIKVFQKF